MCKQFYPLPSNKYGNNAGSLQGFGVLQNLKISWVLEGRVSSFNFPVSLSNTRYVIRDVGWWILDPCYSKAFLEKIKNMSTDFPKLTFIEPDYRFFVDRGQTTEETIRFIVSVLKKFSNDSQEIWEFVNRITKSRDVVFAFFYGSALNINLEISEIEDIDVFMATRNNKFVYDWDRPKGAEIRYHLVSELKNYLRVEKRFFFPVFTEEYNAMGGIFANGILTIKFPKALENTIREVRQNFYKIHIKALSQIVENDCKKRVEKKAFSSHEKRWYAFYGSETLISLDEARLMIHASVNRKNIQPGKAPAIARRILKGMKARSGR